MKGGWARVRSRLSVDRVAAWSVMATTTAFVHWQMFPSKIFRNSDPRFTDLVSHLTLAWYMRHRFLPSGRISGWTMGWFTGMPVHTFYFPLGSVLAALLDTFLPLAVALKVVATLGPLLLPLAAYGFARLNGRDRLASACFGVAVLPLLFEPNLHVFGGSISASAGAGEYAYGLAMTVGLLTLGVVGAGLRTGRYRALAACLLAATVGLHIVPAAAVFVGIVVMTLLPPAKARARWAAPVVATGAALTGVWLVPFLALNPYTGGVDCAKRSEVLAWLLPLGIAPVVAIAAASGVIAALVIMAGGGQRDRLRMFIAIMAFLGAIAFAATPSGQVCNTRFLPLWYLWVCLLAADALAKFARFLDRKRRLAARGQPLASPALAAMLLPAAFLAMVPALWGTRVWEGVLEPSNAGYTRAAEVTLSGYDGDPLEPEVARLRTMVEDLGRRHGCGAAFWEWTTRTGGVEDVGLLMNLPFLTEGCISVARGLYLEASGTTGYVEITEQHLSPKFVHEQVLNLPRGLADLRVLGVRYYITASGEVQRAADRTSQLRLVAEAPRGAGQMWKVYELVPVVEVVEALRHLPVVVPGSGRSRVSWRRVAEPWYRGEARDILLAADGPSSWPRTRRPAADLPRHSAPAATVSDVRIDDERITFDVSRTGVPVLVKKSYFPNWRATGAAGPWRVSPNQMVVVPTAQTVTLRFGRSPWEVPGLAVSLVGLVGVIVLARRPPLPMPSEAEDVPEPLAVKKPPPKRNRPPSKKRR